MQNPVVKRKLQGAPEGRKLIQPYVKKLANIPLNAWEVFRNDYSKYDHLYDPTLKAGIVHAHMVKLGQDLSLRESGVEYMNPYPKQHMLIIENRALVRFKKMDEELNTSNIPTQIQEKLNQRQLDAFEEGNFNHLFNVGYIPNDTWKGVENIVLMESYHDDDPRWVIEFDSNLEVIGDIYGTGDMFDEEANETIEEREVEVKLKEHK